MRKKACRSNYFTGLILLTVTMAPMLGGCARIYYGSVRYEAECVEQDPNYPGKSPVCLVERTK